MVSDAYVQKGTGEGTATTIARRVLATVAAGPPLPSALVDRLVASALDREEVRLALALRDGGPRVVRRAIELGAVELLHLEYLSAHPNGEVKPNLFGLDRVRVRLEQVSNGLNIALLAARRNVWTLP